jgi:putative FmdB family regulatory protein
MPLYEFSCPTCGQIFEKNLSLQDNQANVRCPAGHGGVQRVYSAPPVMFKGSGFYVTDHRRALAGNEAKSDA